jgi:predicted nuclease of restriction endonuclease-like (RecB) superfamily
MNEAAGQGWTTRSLERQISTLYYERLLTTSDRTAVQDEAKARFEKLDVLFLGFLNFALIVEALR